MRVQEMGWVALYWFDEQNQILPKYLTKET